MDDNNKTKCDTRPDEDAQDDAEQYNYKYDLLRDWHEWAAHFGSDD